MSEQEKARAAALGQADWGRHGSAADHHRYAEPIPSPWNRRRCPCGCGSRATHAGMVNGLALTSGCELSMRRWVRDGYTLAPPVTDTEAGRDA